MLVIDDTPENALLLEAILAPHGYSVSMAYSGAEGLEKVRAEHPDVILLDILMPDITGYEVCRRIRANPRTRLLPVIMLTSSGDQDKVNSIEAGADDFIARPLDPRELLSRVRSLLRIKAYQDAMQAEATRLAERNQALEQHFRTQLEHLEELDRLRRAFSPTVEAISPVRRTSSAHYGPEMEGRFRREGEYWTIEFAGSTARFRDAKGMRILARLLADAGRPHAALELERLGLPVDAPTVRAMGTSDAGDLLDDDARRAYRARVAELGEAIEVAAAAGKADEAGLLREEMDFIIHELSRAFGLGGRSRQAGSIAERSRLNVMRAVKSALRHISAVDTVLGTHLDATVHTGTVCVYTPDPRAPISWEVTT